LRIRPVITTFLPQLSAIIKDLQGNELVGEEQKAELYGAIRAIGAEIIRAFPGRAQLVRTEILDAGLPGTENQRD
jgi:hypothetical protein